jgi:hypothetical protein
MIALAFPAVLAAALLSQSVESPTITQSRWTVHEELQLPVMSANHAVGGLGFGVALERGIFALDGEGQILFVAICDQSCGPAYAGGLGVSARPGRWGEVTPRLALLAEYFVHPGLHQDAVGLSTRAGLRWLSNGTGVSLDAALTFTAADNFEIGGFARNKVLSWAIPELMMGFWF